MREHSYFQAGYFRISAGCARDEYKTDAPEMIRPAGIKGLRIEEGSVLFGKELPVRCLFGEDVAETLDD